MSAVKSAKVRGRRAAHKLELMKDGLDIDNRLARSRADKMVELYQLTEELNDIYMDRRYNCALTDELTDVFTAYKNIRAKDVRDAMYDQSSTLRLSLKALYRRYYSLYPQGWKFAPTNLHLLLCTVERLFDLTVKFHGFLDDDYSIPEAE